MQMNFGERLKLARKRKGLTQKELAEMSGVSQQLIGQIEKGEVNHQSFTARPVRVLCLGIITRKLVDYKTRILVYYLQRQSRRIGDHHANTHQNP